MASLQPDRLGLAQGLGVVLATAVAYALVGWVALKLAIPPSYAAAIYPSAGIALAATLVHGRWGLVGTWLGSFAVNAYLTAERGQLAADGLVMALALGVGALLQAAAGRALIRRWVSQPLTLAEPVDQVRFHGLGALLACTVSASVATTGLAWAGVVQAGQIWNTWWAWWVGDTLGVLIGTPVVLTLIGRPRAMWARRRRVVALPMLAATSLLAVASTWVISAHEERVQTAFERDAWSLAVRLESHLRGPQLVLLSMHSLFDIQERVTPPEMRRTARAWLADQPFIVAIGYSQRVARGDLPDFEARVRAEGPVSDYRVFDRSESRVASDDPEVVAIRYIEPLEPNRRALGVNALSIPAAREAVERALASGRSSSTAGFRLTQSAGDETGIVLYQPLYRSTREETLDEAGRRAAFSGLVFVTLRLDAMLDDLIRIQPTYLNWCLIDPDPRAERRRLAGPKGCETAPRAALHFVRPLTISQRPFELHVDARPDGVPGLANGGGWLFSVIGLLATSLLGALLLIVSGRQQRIEAAVASRTADLHSAGQALQASEERLRSIVDHVPIGVVYTDAKGQVREANPSLLAMLAMLQLPDPAPRLLDWTHPADREEVEALMQALASGQPAPARSRIRLVGAAGQVVSVQLGLTALYDASGQPSRLVGVVEDIGEHIRLEASERAREQAEASNRAKSDFVSRMSHELRTPLNAMLGFGQLLARDRSPALAPHQQRWAAQIQDAGWHLLNMINDTLDLSMIESGALRLKPGILDPVALLEACLSLVAGAAERRGVSLRFPAPTRPPGLIRGDETRTKQILTNLLTNAVKYNVDRGRVEVELVPQSDGLLEIRVRDTGLGLSPDQLGQLFQPFNRLGREATGIEGTGIGLVISRRLAELMGGSLEARSQVGQGSTFILRLPLAEHDPSEITDAPPTIPGGEYRRRHVHYVEDNETNVLLMRGMLAQRPQIELTVSELGLDALMAIRQRTPDLLLLDMHLPDIDGMDLLRHLKADPATADLPVLVLSADATRERIEGALAEGAAGYLCKPLNLTELLSRLDELLAQIDTRWG